MKFRTLAGVLALAVFAAPLGGCAAYDKYFCSDCSVSTAAPDVMAAAKKTVTAGYTLHKTAADMSVVLADSGYLHGTNAAKAQALLDQSESVLNLADAAVAAGDATGVEDKVAQALSLINQAEALFAPAKP